MAFDIDISRRVGTTNVTLKLACDDGLTVLFGQSGVGKTSILHMVAGLMPPEYGHIRIDGETVFDAAAGVDVPPHRRRIGYVFQDGRLFPHMSVRANLDFGWRLAKPPERWINHDEVVAFLGIGDLLDRRPTTLSGGEAQRVAIGRALLSGARALLMDEPLSSLDADRRGEIMTVIARVRDVLKLPVLYVTHDIAEANALATRIVRLPQLSA